MIRQPFTPAHHAEGVHPVRPDHGSGRRAGRIIAGVLLQADLFGTGWRMIFLINIPVGVIGTLLAWRYLPDVPRDAMARLDIRGSLLLTAASGLLIYPLVQGREEDWPAWAFVMMAASALLFAAFVCSERRSANPVLEPSLFRTAASSRAWCSSARSSWR